jgi:AraC-like DNA-binding protein
MDVVSDVLRAVRLTGAIFFDLRLGSSFAVETPEVSEIAGSVMPEAEHVICFHTLLEGSCWAQLIGGSSSPLRLGAGDIVAYPIDDRHVLSSTPGMWREPDLARYYRPTDRQLPFVIQRSEGGEPCRIACGYFGCDKRPFNPLLDALPRELHAQGSPDGRGWLSSLVRQAVEESATGRAGGETVLAKLAELMFVEVIRQHIEGLPEDARGWFSALRDRQIGSALHLIHAKPAEDWTLKNLARQVGLSRSVFARRFTHYVGAPPMHYLARWRLQLAARLLREEGVSVGEAAAEVGYESDVAFNRAFKRFVGSPPGAWRKGRVETMANRQSAMRT